MEESTFILSTKGVAAMNYRHAEVPEIEYYSDGTVCQKHIKVKFGYLL